MGCVRIFSILVMAMRVFKSGWLFCRVGCVRCVCKTYKQFMKSVKIYAGSSMFLVVRILSVLYMAISSARKMVCKPGSLFDICISGLVGL